MAGTWLDVQEAAQRMFDSKKAEIDNPIYEVESAWKGGFNNGFKLAVQVLGVPQQDALDRMQAWVQSQSD